MMGKRRIFLLILICWACFNNVYALNGAEHAADMQRIFPFADHSKNKKVTDFYCLVNAFLDYPGQDPTAPFDRSAPKRPLSIANHPKFGNVRWNGKHRIWFHWGFNTDPRHFSPIVNSLNQAVLEGVISQSDITEFWALMNKEISARNKALMNEGARVFGFGELGTISAQQRRQLNALVTILYSVHVIGDHKTTDNAIVAPLSRVFADVNNAIDNLAGKDPENIKVAKQLKQKLKVVQNSPDDYLNALENGFTPFILSLKGEGFDYKTHFKRLGYVLKSK